MATNITTQTLNKKQSETNKAYTTQDENISSFYKSRINAAKDSQFFDESLFKTLGLKYLSIVDAADKNLVDNELFNIDTYKNLDKNTQYSYLVGALNVTGLNKDDPEYATKIKEWENTANEMYDYSIQYQNNLAKEKQYLEDQTKKEQLGAWKILGEVGGAALATGKGLASAGAGAMDFFTSIGLMVKDAINGDFSGSSVKEYYEGDTAKSFVDEKLFGDWYNEYMTNYTYGTNENFGYDEDGNFVVFNEQDTISVRSAFETVGEMLPSIILTGAGSKIASAGGKAATIGNALPKVAHGMYYAQMYSNSLDATFKNPSFASVPTMTILGTNAITSLVEYQIEKTIAKILPSIGNVMIGAGTSKTVLTNFLSKYTSKVPGAIRVGGRYIGSALTEALEEGLQETASGIINSIQGGTWSAFNENGFEINNVIDAMFMGAIVSGILGGAEIGLSHNIQTVGGTNVKSEKLLGKIDTLNFNADLQSFNDTYNEIVNNNTMSVEDKTARIQLLERGITVLSGYMGTIGEARAAKAMEMLKQSAEYNTNQNKSIVTIKSELVSLISDWKEGNLKTEVTQTVKTDKIATELQKANVTKINEPVEMTGEQYAKNKELLEEVENLLTTNGNDIVLAADGKTMFIPEHWLNTMGSRDILKRKSEIQSVQTFIEKLPTEVKNNIVKEANKLLGREVTTEEAAYNFLFNANFVSQLTTLQTFFGNNEVRDIILNLDTELDMLMKKGKIDKNNRYRIITNIKNAHRKGLIQAALNYRGNKDWYAGNMLNTETKKAIENRLAQKEFILNNVEKKAEKINHSAYTYRRVNLREDFYKDLDALRVSTNEEDRAQVEIIDNLLAGSDYIADAGSAQFFEKVDSEFMRQFLITTNSLGLQSNFMPTITDGKYNSISMETETGEYISYKIPVNERGNIIYKKYVDMLNEIISLPNNYLFTVNMNAGVNQSPISLVQLVPEEQLFKGKSWASKDGNHTRAQQIEFILDVDANNKINDVKVSFRNLNGELGRYNPQTNEIILDDKNISNYGEDIITIFYHEYNHYLQNKLGLQGGGNTNIILKRITKVTETNTYSFDTKNAPLIAEVINQMSLPYLNLVGEKAARQLFVASGGVIYLNQKEMDNNMVQSQLQLTDGSTMYIEQTNEINSFEVSKETQRKNEFLQHHRDEIKRTEDFTMTNDDKLYTRMITGKEQEVLSPLLNRDLSIQDKARASIDKIIKSPSKYLKKIDIEALNGKLDEESVFRYIRDKVLSATNEEVDIVLDRNTEKGKRVYVLADLSLMNEQQTDKLKNASYKLTSNTLFNEMNEQWKKGKSVMLRQYFGGNNMFGLALNTRIKKVPQKDLDTYYDQDTNTIYLGRNIENNSELRYTLAHEYEHVLQRMTKVAGGISNEMIIPKSVYDDFGKHVDLSKFKVEDKKRVIESFIYDTVDGERGGTLRRHKYKFFPTFAMRYSGGYKVMMPWHKNSSEMYDLGLGGINKFKKYRGQDILNISKDETTGATTYQRKESRNVAKTIWNRGAMKFYKNEQGRVIVQMSQDMQKFLTSITNVAYINKEIRGALKAGKLTRENIMQWIQITDNMNDYTFDKIRKAFFPNTQIKSFSELQYVVNNIADIDATVRIILDGKIKNQSKISIDKLERSVELTKEKANEKFNTYREQFFLYKKRDTAGKFITDNGKNIIDTIVPNEERARITILRDFDGSIESLKHIANTIRVVSRIEQTFLEKQQAQSLNEKVGKDKDTEVGDVSNIDENSASYKAVRKRIEDLMVEYNEDFDNIIDYRNKQYSKDEKIDTLVEYYARRGLSKFNDMDETQLSKYIGDEANLIDDVEVLKARAIEKLTNDLAIKISDWTIDKINQEFASKIIAETFGMAAPIETTPLVKPTDITNLGPIRRRFTYVKNRVGVERLKKAGVADTEGKLIESGDLKETLNKINDVMEADIAREQALKQIKKIPQVVEKVIEKPKTIKEVIYKERVVLSTDIFTLKADRPMPVLLEKMLRNYKGRTEQSNVKFGTNIPYEKRSWNTFIEQNAELFSSMDTTDAIQLATFILEADINASTNNENDRNLYDIARLYILSFIEEGAVSGRFTIEENMIDKIKQERTIISSRYGQGLSAVNQIQKMVNPNMVMAQKLIKRGFFRETVGTKGINNKVLEEIIAAKGDLDKITIAVSKIDEELEKLKKDKNVDEEYFDQLKRDRRRIGTALKSPNMEIELPKVIEDIKEQSYRGQKLAELNKAVEEGNVETIDKLTTEIAREQLALEKDEDTWFEKTGKWLVGVRYSFMLSGPQTWIRNIFSNVQIGLMNKANNKIGNAVGKFLDKLTGGRIDKTKDLTMQHKLNVKPDTETLKFISKTLIENGMFDAIFTGMNKYDEDANINDTANMYVNKIREKMRIEGQTWFGKFIGKMISDAPYTKKRAIEVFSKLLQENKSNAEVLAGIKENKSNDTIMNLLADAVALANYEYMRRDSFIRDFEIFLKENQPAIYNIWKFLLPFANSAINWFVESYRYTPMGLIHSIIDMAKAEKFMEKLDNLRAKGKALPSSRFTEFLIKQNIGKGVFGTVTFIIGALLVSAGILGVDDEDDKYLIKIGDLRVDVTNVFGSSSLLMAAAIFSNDNAFDALGEASDIFLNEFLLMSLLTDWKYSGTPFDYVIGTAANGINSYVPSFLKLFNRMLQEHEVKFSSGLGYYWDRFVVDLVPTAYNWYLPKKINPYTGEAISKYSLPIWSRVSQFFPFRVSEYVVTDTQKADLLYTGSARNEIGTNGYKEFTLDAKQLEKQNKWYGELNQTRLDNFMNDYDRYEVQNIYGNTVSLTYSQMTDEQRRLVFNRIFTQDQTYAKVYGWTNILGHSYYTTRDEYRILKELGVENVFIQTNTNKGYIN